MPRIAFVAGPLAVLTAPSIATHRPDVYARFFLRVVRKGNLTDWYRARHGDFAIRGTRRAEPSLT